MMIVWAIFVTQRVYQVHTAQQKQEWSSKYSMNLCEGCEMRQCIHPWWLLVINELRGCGLDTRLKSAAIGQANMKSCSSIACAKLKIEHPDIGRFRTNLGVLCTINSIFAQTVIINVQANFRSLGK